MAFRLCIDLEAAPVTDAEVNLTPVDYVARSIVSLSRSPDSVGKTFHLMNPRPVPVCNVPGDPHGGMRTGRNAVRPMAIALDWRASRSDDEMLTALSHWLPFLPADQLIGTLPPRRRSSAARP